MAPAAPLRALRSVRSRLRQHLRANPDLSRRVLPWTERVQSVRARIRPHVPERPLELVVHEYAKLRPDATFVQVGAHDGTQLDPLREAILGSQWRGVMVEPVPYVFERLAARYHANPRVMLENVAVADVDGVKPFHFIPQAEQDDDVWRWYDALGSFRRDVVLTHDEFVGDIADRLVTVDIPCVTFDTLCERNRLRHVDVVQMDTEGYDRDVLELIDLERLGVELVVFEHLHLSDDDRAACRALLESQGFEQTSDGMDTIAVRSGVLDGSSLRATFDDARMALREFDQ